MPSSSMPKRKMERTPEAGIANLAQKHTYNISTDKTAELAHSTDGWHEAVLIRARWDNKEEETTLSQ
eukprot:2791998-Pleurochrysis_carterae.AAC.1